MADLDTVRIFELDPDLLQGLDGPTAAHLRARGIARQVWAERGPWTPPVTERETSGHLGLLLIDGFVIRTLRLAGRECSELSGPGDLLIPWCDPDTGGSVPCTSDWRALQRSRFAALDAVFARSVVRWPTITAALLQRSMNRCRSLAYQSAIAHVRHAETRVLLELWHVADRWGTVTSRGVVVPVPLTHQLLAQLTCLQRPTVTAALGNLEREGAVGRGNGGGWLLLGRPPDGLGAAPGEWRHAPDEEALRRSLTGSPIA